MLLLLVLFSFACSVLALPPSELSLRIFNGTAAAKGQFPWQAALYFTKNDGIHFCGGSLISEQWILTAAHCVSDALFRIKVLLGTTDLRGDDPNAIVLHSLEWIQHETFIPSGLENDIGAVKLPIILSFSDYIKPINLASKELEAGVSVTVSGWGQTIDGGGSPTTELNFSHLFTIKNEDCKGYVYEETVCAMPDPNSDAQNICGGDSGGGMVTDAATNPVHVALVSWDSGCVSGVVAGFTRTAYYRDWIRNNTGV